MRCDFQEGKSPSENRKGRTFPAEGALFLSIVDGTQIGDRKEVIRGCILSLCYSPHPHSYACRDKEKLH